MHTLDAFVSDCLLLVRADSKQVKLERTPSHTKSFSQLISSIVTFFILVLWTVFDFSHSLSTSLSFAR